MYILQGKSETNRPYPHPPTARRMLASGCRAGLRDMPRPAGCTLQNSR